MSGARTKPHRAVTILAGLADAAERGRGARLSRDDLRALMDSALGEQMRACLAWGRSLASDGLEPPDLHPRPEPLRDQP